MVHPSLNVSKAVYQFPFMVFLKYAKSYNSVKKKQLHDKRDMPDLIFWKHGEKRNYGSWAANVSLFHNV